MTVNVCGWYRLHPSASGASIFEVAGECAMLLAGPVGRLKVFETCGGLDRSATRDGRGGVLVRWHQSVAFAGEGKDAFRGWPVIDFVRQKQVQAALPHA